MDKLQQLIDKCKCSVEIEVNGHKDVYQSVKDYINDWGDGDEANEIELEILAKMIATDTIIRIHYYPRTPIGFNVCWHYDLESALDECLNFFND